MTRKSLVGGRPTWHKEPIIFFNKMLTLCVTANHVVMHCSIYACVMSQMFLFFLWGCFGFSWGCWAPASPSLVPPMPKGILGWESGAERIERAERNLQKALSAPAPLRSRSTPLTCSALYTLTSDLIIAQTENKSRKIHIMVYGCRP